VRQLPDDGGFTLVEQVVALMIAAIVFTAAAYAMIGGLKQSSFAQQNQQSADMLNQAVEQARAVPYDQLAMRPADLATNDPLNTGSCNCNNPATGGKTGTGVETLVLDAAGAMNPHVVVVPQNHLTFTLRNYVTQPTDAVGAVYKRLTVVATWTSQGKSHTRKSSTLIAPTQRGLPLPDFKYTATSAVGQCINPAATLVYAFNLRNNGARDGWNFQTSSSSANAPTWAWYSDVDANGVYTAGTDTALGTDSSTSRPWTGSLEPTTAVRILAVATAPSAGSVPPPYTWNITFTATSVAQPSYAQSIATATTVQSTVCSSAPTPTSTATPTTPTPTPSTTTPTPSTTATATVPPTQPTTTCTAFTAPSANVNGSGTLRQYVLHNGSTNVNNTTAQSTMLISKTAAVSTTLWNYSTDVSSTTAGRYLTAPGAAGTASMADFRYTMPAVSKLKGTATATIFAAPASGASTENPTFSVTLSHLNSAGTAVLSGDTTTTTFTPGSWGCAGFRAFTVALDTDNSGWTIAANDLLQVTVKVTNSVPMILAYDTTAFTSGLILPVTSGVG
jgi:prepilin-type N-terminal cleavage/methylation domain-containing protein